MKKRLFTSILVMMAAMALPSSVWADTETTVLEVDYATKATNTWQVTSGNTGSQKVTRGTATTINGTSYNPFSVVKGDATLLEEHGVYVSSGDFYLSCTGAQFIGLRCTNNGGASMAIKGLLAGDVIEIATNGGDANSSTPTVSAPSYAVNATISESTGVYKHDFTHDTSRSAYYNKYDITVSDDGDVSFNVAQNCYIAYIKVSRSTSEPTTSVNSVTGWTSWTWNDSKLGNADVTEVKEQDGLYLRGSSTMKIGRKSVNYNGTLGGKSLSTTLVYQLDPTSTFSPGSIEANAQVDNTNGNSLALKAGVAGKVHIALTTNTDAISRAPAIYVNGSNQSLTKSDWTSNTFQTISVEIPSDATFIIGNSEGSSLYFRVGGIVFAPKHTITNSTTDTNGTVSISGDACVSDEMTITINPNEGYELDQLTVTKTGENTTKVDVTDKKFTMPDYDVTVTATFKKKRYSLSASVDNGTITLKKDNAEGADINSGAEVEWGTMIYVTAIPTDAENNYLSSLKYGETDVASGATFEMPQAATTVTATFAARTDISGATVTLSSNSLTHTGSAQAPTVTGVSLNETNLAEGTDYSVNEITQQTEVGSNYTITVTGIGKYKGTASATWAIVAAAATPKVTITDPTSSGGSISVKNGETAVTSGGEIAENTSLTLTATPESGYQLKTWKDGTGNALGTLPKSLVQTYSMPSTDVTITAEFEAVPSVSAVETAKTWTFDNFVAGTILTINTPYGYDGYYVTGHNEEISKGAKISAESASATAEQFGGEAVSVSNCLYFTGNQANTSINANKDVKDGLANTFAFRAGCKGVLYVLVKNSKDESLNIYINGARTQQSITTSASVVSAEISEAANIFIGANGGSPSIYAVRFVPTSTTAITDEMITLRNNGTLTYTGEQQTMTVTVKNGDTNLVENTDYTVTGNTGTEVNTYTLTVTGTGSYSGSIEKTWSIGKGAGSISYATTEITKTVGEAAFTNELTKVGDGTVTYSISTNGTGSTIDSDGTVTVGNTAGTETITATVANGTNYDYATTTATYTLTVNAQAAEETISTAKTWTFDSYNTGGYYANNSNSYIAVDGLYARSLDTRKFVITAGSEATAYSFTDGTSGSVTNYAKISGEYSGTNATVTSAAQNSGYLTPFFAFNTSVAGTCYAWVKSSGNSGENVRIYYTSGNGLFTCPDGAYTNSSGFKELKQTATAGGTFFIGSTTNAVGEIYAIHFVPTHKVSTSIVPPSETSATATVTVKNGDATVGADTYVEEGKTLMVEVSGITSGYEVEKVEMNSTDITSSLSDGKYSFTMPVTTSDVTVKVTLKATSTTPATTYTVIKAEATNGSFTVSSESAEANATITVTTTPNDGYEVDAVTVKDAENNDVAVSGSGNSYTFTMPAKNVTVTVTFKQTAVVPTEFSYGTFDFKNFVIENDLANGTKPTWGATIDGADVQVLTYVSGSINQTFGNRFATGPVAQNATDNCFKFRKYDGDTYTGLYSEFENRTFSILGLNAGDRITFTFASANTTLTYGNSVSVVNNQTITVTEAGRMDFTSVKGVVITQVKIEAPLTQYTVTAESSNTDQGTVAITDASSDNKYDQGSSVTITATAKSGYEFDYWTNGESTDSYSTTNPLTITSLDANFTLKAHFKAQSTTPVTSSYWTYNYAQMAVAMITADNSKNSITWTRNTNSKTTVNSKDMYPVYIDGYQSEGNLLADRGDGILKFGDVYNIGLTNNENATNYYAIKNVKANDIIEIVYNGGGTSSAMNTLPALENLNNATVSNETSSYTLKFNYGNKDRTLDYTVKTLTVTADGPVSFSLKDGYIAKITVGTAYTVNANVTQESYGTVSVTSPDYMLLGDKFIKGTDVTLKAEPAAGKEFVKWTDGSNDVSTDNPYTITNLSANTTLTAVFQESTVMYNIKVTAGANGSVTVTKGSDNVTSSVTGESGQDYVTGTSLTLTATADQGYKFKNWTNSGGTEVSTENPYTITLTEAMGLTANFEESAEETVGTTTMWTFNSMGEVATETTGISVIQNGLYNRSASSGRGFTIKSESVSGLKFSDGTSVGAISYVAFSNAKAYAGEMKNLTAGASGNEATPYFAFNASVAGICYALVKNGTDGKSRINFGKGDGTAIANVESKKTDVIEELSYTSSEPGVFFIGGAVDYKERTIYAIRFVPLTELQTPKLSVSTADHGTVTAKINTTTVEEGGNTDVTTGSKVTLTVTPDDGYELDQLVTTGGATISSDKSFTMPSTDVTISATFKTVSSETPTEEVKEYGTVVDASNATVTGVEIGEKTTTVSISGTINGTPVTSITDDTFTAENTANVGAIDLSKTKIDLTGKREEIPALQNINSATLIYMPSTANVTGKNIVTQQGTGQSATYTCSEFEVDNTKLEDGKSVVVPKEFTAEKATLNRTFTASQKCTVCLPYSFARTGGKFYKFVGISGGKVQMAEQTTDMLEANTPYIFEPSANADGITTNTGSIAVSISDAPNTEVSSASFTFKGTYEKIEWTNPTGIYGFAAEGKDGATVGSFVRVGAGASIMACRAYLEYTGNETINGLAATRGMSGLPAILEIEWIPAEKGRTTGITRTELQNDDDAPVYSISGQRVDSSYKGLVIKNGKKVVRK